MAPIRMTRAEYEAKYGAPPTPQASSPAPVKMTRAEYETKYGMSPSNQQPVIAKPILSPQERVLASTERMFGTQDTTADLKQIGTDIKLAKEKRREKVAESITAMNSGQQGYLRTTLQTAGQFGGFAADALGAGIKGLIKGALPQGGEEVVKNVASSVISPIINSDTAQVIKAKYNEIKDTNPKLARDIDAALGAVDLLSNFVGVGAAGKAGTVGAKVAQTTAKVAGETLEAGAKLAPKLLSYTSDVPETAFKVLSERTPAVTKAIKTGVTAEQARDTVVNAVKGFRKTLSKEWDDGVQGIIKENEAIRFGLTDSLTNKALKIADEFGIELPQNIKNISANEAVGLLKKINELPTAMLTLSPKGALVREFKQELKDLAVKSFGGEKGQFAQLYTNYSTKKSVLDAANDIVNAYAGNKPIKVATAQSRLTKIFDENKTAYLDAIIDLEKATGQDLLSNVVAGKFSKIIPQASGLTGGLTQKALKLLLFPLTSPRGAAFIQNSLNRVSKGLSDFLVNPKLGASTKRLKITPDDVKILQQISDAFKEQAAVKVGKGATVPIPSGVRPKVEQEILANFGIPVEGKSIGSIAKIIDELLAKVKKK